MTNEDLVITVRFEGEPTFSGIRAGDDPFEWPPSPARLLSALIAGAATISITDPDQFKNCLSSIRVLETLPNPKIVAADARTDARDPLHFAPKVTDYPTPSWKVDKKNDLTPPTTSRKSKAYENSLRKGVWPGFKGLSEVANVGKWINGSRTLLHPEVAYYVQVQDSKTRNQLKKDLDVAAAGVPYFGSSRDTATVSVTTGSLDNQNLKSRAIYRPIERLGRDKGWAPGLVDHLLKRHELLTSEGTDIGHPDHIVKKLSYLAIRPGAIHPTLTIATAETIQITDTAKRIGELNDAIEKNGLSVRVIPMVNHLHPKSDGKLKGILVIPDPLDEDDGFTKIAEAAPVLADQERFPWLDETSVSDGHVQNLQSLRPRSVLEPTKIWQSATPVRSYPSVEYARARMLLDLEKITGVETDEVGLNIHPASPATREFGRGHTLGAAPGFDRGMVPWHVEVEFPKAVQGPIQIGADTRLGYGLFVPFKGGGKR